MLDSYEDAYERFRHDPNHCFIPIVSPQNINTHLRYDRSHDVCLHFGVNEGRSEQMLDVMSVMEHGARVRMFAPDRIPTIKSMIATFSVNKRHFKLGRFNDGTLGVLATLQDGTGLLMPL